MVWASAEGATRRTSAAAAAGARERIIVRDRRRAAARVTAYDRGRATPPSPRAALRLQARPRHRSAERLGLAADLRRARRRCTARGRRAPCPTGRDAARLEDV